MSNSPLITYTKLSPFCTKPRSHKIDTITIHHMAGNLTVERCGSVFQHSGTSANYGVDGNGGVGLYVDEANRSWASASPANDNRAVTIEVANDRLGGDWHVSDRALEKLIELCADICRRNGIERLNYTGDKTGNLTMHKWFVATLCPGPYLESKFLYIAQKVNERLEEPELTKEEVRVIAREEFNALLAQRDKMSADSWAEPFIRQAKELGITANGERPQSFLTRQEGITMAVKAVTAAALTKDA